MTTLHAYDVFSKWEDDTQKWYATCRCGWVSLNYNNYNSADFAGAIHLRFQS